MGLISCSSVANNYSIGVASFYDRLSQFYFLYAHVLIFIFSMLSSFLVRACLAYCNSILVLSCFLNTRYCSCIPCGGRSQVNIVLRLIVMQLLGRITNCTNKQVQEEKKLPDIMVFCVLRVFVRVLLCKCLFLILMFVCLCFVCTSTLMFVLCVFVCICACISLCVCVCVYACMILC